MAPANKMARIAWALMTREDMGTGLEMKVVPTNETAPPNAKCGGGLCRVSSPARRATRRLLDPRKNDDRRFIHQNAGKRVAASRNSPATIDFPRLILPWCQSYMCTDGPQSGEAGRIFDSIHIGQRPPRWPAGPPVNRSQGRRTCIVAASDRIRCCKEAVGKSLRSSTSRRALPGTTAPC